MTALIKTIGQNGCKEKYLSKVFVELGTDFVIMLQVSVTLQVLSKLFTSKKLKYDNEMLSL